MSAAKLLVSDGKSSVFTSILLLSLKLYYDLLSFLQGSPGCIHGPPFHIHFILSLPWKTATGHTQTSHELLEISLGLEIIIVLLIVKFTFHGFCPFKNLPIVSSWSSFN